MLGPGRACEMGQALSGSRVVVVVGEDVWGRGVARKGVGRDGKQRGNSTSGQSRLVEIMGVARAQRGIARSALGCGKRKGLSVALGGSYGSEFYLNYPWGLGLGAWPAMVPRVSTPCHVLGTLQGTPPAARLFVQPGTSSRHSVRPCADQCIKRAVTCGRRACRWPGGVANFQMRAFKSLPPVCRQMTAQCFWNGRAAPIG